MTHITRRTLTSQLAALMATAHTPAFAQSTPVGPANATHLNYNDIIRRARELAAAPFASMPALPEPLLKLDETAWRDIHFRSDKALIANATFRVQPIHLGASYKQAVTINIVRDGIATPIPYAATMFDYGRAKIDRNLPVNIGFAGVQIMTPLNDPRIFEACFDSLGLTSMRPLGRDQRAGLSARAVTVNAGQADEEFPFYREIWIEASDANSDMITLYALLDSPSVTGALRIELTAGQNTYADITTTLYPRKANIKFGCAPLSSLFFTGKNDHRLPSDHRPELHDSDGLLMNSGAGEWIWRPLRNPDKTSTTAFLDTNLRGFGLIQRDRHFDHYQDLSHHYESHPSYWIEPRDGWGNGRIELVEAPTTNAKTNNITASWVFASAAQPGQALTYAYRLTAYLDHPRLSPNARAINTFQEPSLPLGSTDPITPSQRRFILDFAGEELAYYQDNPLAVEFVPSTTAGRIIKKDLVYNPDINGFRAQFDVDLGTDQTTDLRAFLRAGSRTLSETWTFPWKPD
jgi:periplasmic glucans biosynthesis protein